MHCRLNEREDEAGSLSLTADGKKQHVGEFRVGDGKSIPVDVEAGKPIGKPPVDERSALLKCAPPGILGGGNCNKTQ